VGRRLTAFCSRRLGYSGVNLTAATARMSPTRSAATSPATTSSPTTPPRILTLTTHLSPHIGDKYNRRARQLRHEVRQQLRRRHHASYRLRSWQHQRHRLCRHARQRPAHRPPSSIKDEAPLTARSPRLRSRAHATPRPRSPPRTSHSQSPLQNREVSTVPPYTGRPAPQHAALAHAVISKSAFCLPFAYLAFQTLRPLRSKAFVFAFVVCSFPTPDT